MVKDYEYLESLAGTRPYNVERDELYQAYFKVAYDRKYKWNGKLKTIKIDGISKESEAEETCIDHNPVRSRSTGGAQ